MCVCEGVKFIANEIFNNQSLILTHNIMLNNNNLLQYFLLLK